MLVKITIGSVYPKYIHNRYASPSECPSGVNVIRKFNVKIVPITISNFGPNFSTINLLILDYATARPRMKYYEEVSAQIYGIYLRYIAPEDIYSIGEVFIDVISYLKVYDCTAQELAENIIDDVYYETGLTATVKLIYTWQKLQWMF